MSASKFIIYPMRYVSPFLRSGPKSEPHFVEKLGQFIGGDVDVHLLGRARTGVWLLCKIAARNGRHRVLMSPYTIPDVVNMVRLAGCTPVFVDFLPNSTNFDLDVLKQEIDDETACVLLTHYHVNQEHTREIVQLCHDRGAYCFDDCAISFGGTLDGVQLGAVTDASVFSFSFFKTLNFFWGGSVTTHRDDISEEIGKLMADFGRLEPRDYLSQMRKSAKLDMLTRGPIFSSVVFPRLQRRARSTESAPDIAFTRLETRKMDRTLLSKPSPAMSHELMRKLPGIPDILAHRRRIAAIYDRYFADVAIATEASANVKSGSTYSVYPVAVPPETRAETRGAIIRAGFDVGTSIYPSVTSIARFDFCQGSAPRAQALSESMIFLPTHPRASPAYAEQLAAAARPIIDKALARGAADTSSTGRRAAMA